MAFDVDENVRAGYWTLFYNDFSQDIERECLSLAAILIHVEVKASLDDRS